ncbi:MAG: hypothetical protein AABX16_02305 [Nanoarchaeota archaeon]
MKQNTELKEARHNIMRDISIEKMVIHCGGIDEKLERSVKLLQKITKEKVFIKKSTKRIPDFGISPGKKSGCKVTIRDKEKITQYLKRFFSAIDSKLSGRQFTENQLCFGIKEYIEVPGLDYDREIGILGFEVMLVFKRAGKRTTLRKIKAGKFPRRQQVTPQEIREYIVKHFKVRVGK